MSVVSTNAFGKTRAPGRVSHDLPGVLLDHGLIDQQTLSQVRRRLRRGDASLSDILLRNGYLDQPTLLRAEAEAHGLSLVTDLLGQVDTRRLDLIGPAACLAATVLPLKSAGAITPVAVASADHYGQVAADLSSHLGETTPCLATADEIQAVLWTLRRRQLAKAAERRAPRDLSARSLSSAGLRMLILGPLALAMAALVAAPLATLAVMVVVAVINLSVFSALQLYALLGARIDSEGSADAIALKQPKVSILVPLFKEREIAEALIGRLGRIDYPRELLQIVMVMEEDDLITRSALLRADLPPWMELAVVAEGTVKTKPRALNFALGRCDGDIIGIYDAEDAPAPDQIQRIVSRFGTLPPDVACLQGRLNFYNAEATWLTRCFCMEYTGWFNLMLPALERLGWPVPLGGTTLFIKREAIETAGGWDAHNVTEDADLGLRLARMGRRTVVVETTTMEEAVSCPRAWVNQRSRWQKGFAMTWAAHMRRPVALWHDLGPWKLMGMQVLFLGSLASPALAPGLWIFSLLTLVAGHGFEGVMPGWAMAAITTLLFVALLVDTTCHAVALTRDGRRRIIKWMPLRFLYFPLASLSLAKALFEMTTRPFFWHKTTHGVTEPDRPQVTAEPLTRPSAGFRTPARYAR